MTGIIQHDLLYVLFITKHCKLVSVDGMEWGLGFIHLISIHKMLAMLKYRPMFHIELQPDKCFLTSEDPISLQMNTSHTEGNAYSARQPFWLLQLPLWSKMTFGLGNVGCSLMGNIRSKKCHKALDNALNKSWYQDVTKDSIMSSVAATTQFLWWAMAVNRPIVPA